MEVAAAHRPTVPQVVLGLFISWQLLFLPAANYLAFLPHGQPEEGELSDSRCSPDETGGTGAVQKAINFSATITEAWASLTGQVQAWWLFAPDVPRAATFALVELRWDDAANPTPSTAGLLPPPAIPPVRLHMPSEPDDPSCYFRSFSGLERLFHYEVRLGLILANWNEQSFAEHPEFWHAAITNRVRRQGRSIQAYLGWKVRQFQQEHPELPMPKQAILWIRMYPILEPEQLPIRWGQPMERPLARWWVDSSPRPGELPIEAFDPEAGHFTTLRVED